MRNDGQKPEGGVAAAPMGRTNGFIPSSFRAISSYLRIVSSGASTVASTVRSAASSIVVDSDDDARYNQVLWAGFDKLECERDVMRRVLLLGYRTGFQVWDVEEAHNVRDLVSRHDGPVSFVQMLRKPLPTMASTDQFSDSHPLLVVCRDGSLLQNGINAPGNGYYGPSTVQFYSLTSHSYVHVLKFRSAVYSVRCSPRVVAVSQATQVYCFNAATLEREYTILTNPVVTGGPSSGGIGYGPLALGPRWMAYSGSLVEMSNAGRVSPQHLTPSATFPSPVSKGSHVAHYAMESSKHLAAGIVTLGDVGYKKLSRYCSELSPDSNHLNGHPHDMDNVGMVVVKDVVSKAVITQFKAHKSSISALCFDPSGTLLVTASVQGRNINVFRIMPGASSASDASASYVHLYRLQRGLTNAIIQDITFSDDSRWIMISSSRGTNHLFAISPFGGIVDPSVKLPPQPAAQIFNQKGPPVTLSVVSRIRNGHSGWRGTVDGAIAAAFHLSRDNDMRVNSCDLKSKYHLLVFSPSGCLIQYALRVALGLDTTTVVNGLSPSCESGPASNSKVLVEATQKWNICQKRREREDNFDIYGENGSSYSNKMLCEGTRMGYGTYTVGKCKVNGSKVNPEERKHFYVSEAELQMHAQQIPLWARSQIYFQSMMTDGINLDGYNAGGEIEIESFPARTIEARSKNLVPVFDSLDNNKSQSTRIAASGYKFGPQQLPQVSGLSKNDKLSSGGRPYGFGLMTENGAEIRNGNGETMDGLLKLSDTMAADFVNNIDSPRKRSQLEIVNNRDREHLKTEAPLKFVNNNNEALKSENLFEDEGEEFD